MRNASYLAKKYARHEDYLQIQVEDAGSYKEALAYMRKLGAEAVSRTFTPLTCQAYHNGI